MRAYWAIVSARFRMLLQYRAAAMAGFGTQLFWGLIRMMIFTAFYESTDAPQPMSLDETITYVWLGQALICILPWNWDREIEGLIRSGNVSYELVRPVDLYGFWFCRMIALRSAPTLLRCIPMFIVAGLFLGLQAPASWASFAAFVLALFGALMLSCALSELVTISMFWTISGEGIGRLVCACTVLLSGMIVPLPFFPDWAQPILNALPFRGVVDVPFRLYMGHMPPHAIGEVLAFQLTWTAGLVVAGRWVLSRGLRRLVLQGG